jgi:SagB-type dehydrogenase family enzyme
MNKKTVYKINTDFLLKKPVLPWEKFHQKTTTKKFKRTWPKDIPLEWRKIFYKSYPRLNAFPLSNPYLSEKISLKKSLLDRYSKREYTDKKVTLEELSAIFYFSSGLKQSPRTKLVNRFYPSAGGRYPLELYLISLNTELPKGLYHYNVKSHCLEDLLRFKSFNTNDYFKFSWLQKAGGIIVISGIFKRTIIKYGDLGYRYVLFECGHMVQNIHLLASGLDIGSCAIGGFIDKKINKLLDIDGVSEAVLYAVSLGH